MGGDGWVFDSQWVWSFALRLSCTPDFFPADGLDPRCRTSQISHTGCVRWRRRSHPNAGELQQAVPDSWAFQILNDEVVVLACADGLTEGQFFFPLHFVVPLPRPLHWPSFSPVGSPHNNHWITQLSSGSKSRWSKSCFLKIFAKFFWLYSFVFFF